MITLIMFLAEAYAVPQAGQSVEINQPATEAQPQLARCWWCWIFGPGADRNPDSGPRWRPRGRYAITPWSGGCDDEYCWRAEANPQSQPVLKPNEKPPT